MTGRSLRDRWQRRRASARRRVSRWLPAFALAAFLLLPGEAFGHAILTHSNPHASATVNESPGYVQFDFNEPVEVTSGSIRLFDDEGGELSAGAPEHPGGQAEKVAVDVPAELEEGVYTATYRVISADGHPVSGGFSFGVRAPVRTEGRTAPAVADLLDRSDSQPALEILYGVARGLQYLALLLLIGSCFFRALVWRGGGDARWPTGTLFAAAFLGLGASLAGVAFQGALVAGVGLDQVLDHDVIEGGLDTKVGAVWAARVGLWLGLVGLATWGGLPSRLRAVATGLVTAGVVATIPLGGHATTHSPEAVLVGADVTHVVGAGAWLGGLVLLLITFWPRRSDGEVVGAEGVSATASFSRLALVAVAALFAAGLLQSWFYLDGSISELVSGTYGLLLLAKLALLTGIVAIARLNRRRVSGLAAGAGASAVALRRAMRWEVGLAIVVLGVTAALVRTAPPAVVPGPVTRELDVGEIRVEMIIEPATTGPNDYHLYLFDRETGEQVRRVKDMTLRLTQPEEGIGPITLEVPYKNAAHYELLGPALSVPGTWDVALDVRVSRFDLYTARTEIEVSSR